MYKFDAPRVERFATVITSSQNLDKGTVLSYSTADGGYIPADVDNSKYPHAILLEDLTGSAEPSVARVLLEGIVFTDEFDITDADVLAYLDMVGIHVYKREDIPTL